ncbi:MAG: sigma-54-dependent Fis family transcriptional regulator [Acidobacteria bacterium]|nr:sigma-54-dependent Fis family transcriptional regulator [Acidobacteriota bacterium]
MEAGLDRIQGSRYDAVVACFPSEHGTVEEFLDQVQRIDAGLPVVIRAASAGLGDAVRWSRLGGFQVLERDADPELLHSVIEAAAEYRRSSDLASLSRAAEGRSEELLIGRSPAIQNVIRMIRLIARRKANVLIQGETGTGKEMAARAIHAESGRGNLPMVAVNCGALPENLLEAELFGHVRGAFTGAVQHRVGRFEQANRSTIFLDEIGDVPFGIQAKLLRVLQEREFERVGSSEPVRVDVRVVSATNVNLADKIREGAFREDLFYRLNVVSFAMPALRDRPMDIPLLVEHFTDQVCQEEGLPLKKVPAETMERLTRYSWPGNIRQLRNAIESAIALSGDRPSLFPADFRLPPESRRPAPAAALAIHVPDHGLNFEETISRIELQILEQALQKTRGNKKQAADLLRLKRTTLTAKLKSLGASAGETA